MSFQRARQPEQKAQRRTSILEAAAVVFEETPYDAVSLKDVAAEAGIGKASLYTYFRTKEEIFLELYRADMESWLDSVEVDLGQIAPEDAAELARVLTAAVVAQPRACRLGVLLNTVLERNLPAEVLLDFKRGILGLSGRFLVALARILPGVQPVDLMTFAIDHFALVSGLWPMANPASEVCAIMATAPDLAPLQVQLAPTLQRSLYWMAMGMLAAR